MHTHVWTTCLPCSAEVLPNRHCSTLCGLASWREGSESAAKQGNTIIPTAKMENWGTEKVSDLPAGDCGRTRDWPHVSEAVGYTLSSRASSLKQLSHCSCPCSLSSILRCRWIWMISSSKTLRHQLMYSLKIPMYPRGYTDPFTFKDHHFIYIKKSRFAGGGGGMS